MCCTASNALSPSIFLFSRSNICPRTPHPRQCWEEWRQALLFLPRESLWDGPESHDPVQDRPDLPGELSHQSTNLMLIITRERFISSPVKGLYASVMVSYSLCPVSSSPREPERKPRHDHQYLLSTKRLHTPIPSYKTKFYSLPPQLTLGRFTVMFAPPD